LDRLPFDRLPPHPVEAVCLLSQNQDQWGTAYSSYILARQAGFELEFQSGEQPLQPAALYLVPSVRGINVISRRRWLELLERVRQGATLYLSLDDAILSGFQAAFGLEPLTRQRRTQPEIQFTIPGAGDFRLPAAFSVDFALSGAEVLGSESNGRPAFTRFDYGKGQVFFLAAPLERALTETPGAFNAPETRDAWRIYARIGAGVLAQRAVSKTQPFLGVSEHALAAGQRAIIAINYSPEPLRDTLRLAPGWALAAAYRGAPQAQPGGLDLSLPANDAAVFIIESGG
jgi:hypothetical protein